MDNDVRLNIDDVELRFMDNSESCGYREVYDIAQYLRHFLNLRHFQNIDLEYETEIKERYRANYPLVYKWINSDKSDLLYVLKDDTFLDWNIAKYLSVGDWFSPIILNTKTEISKELIQWADEDDIRLRVYRKVWEKKNLINLGTIVSGGTGWEDEYRNSFS